ncbi:hypothetical protein HKBW3S43_00861 [Candidatus Hakubella thermalkaliphila]|uniref:HicB-like antitoxin of toxin-antitoxin system domain-containing protein n=1 Tax=Candidatus Hakubella thermalkaliphila TaxID=2754717 RepID=A0A6V8P5U8_9ACTN|nr:type II toxin-antitoxin system HicB family antitoxin [Candidatus Hakubella thermalkaliphila]GFP28012.1 hypothetical protein HKBW3S33_01429 [Candidatus Hakubella thermalkaliphila]GFP35069.1 hypothetical protein HKBW3S43_00861 [Candidatus Hakubella thermalkaliphila]
MFKYEVIIYWSEEDGLFIAEVPELPGCMADGTTYEEAIRNAEIVISEWIETAKSLGREIPIPKGIGVYPDLLALQDPTHNPPLKVKGL